MNKFNAPPRIKGLDEAVTLLSVISNAKELDKLIKPLMDYNKEAAEYFKVMGGMKVAEKAISDAENEADLIVKSAEEEAEKLKVVADDLFNKAQIEFQKAKEQSKEAAHQIRELEDLKNAISLREKEVNERLENISKEEASISKARAEVEKRETEVAQKMDALNKIKLDMGAI